MSASKWKTRLGDHLIGLFLAAVYLAVLLATAKDVGFARDEGFYFHAARLYQGWFDVLFDEPSEAMEPRVIAKHWKYNYEHPALMKTLFGFSNRLLNKSANILSPSNSFRFPGMVFAALIVYLLYLWGARFYGRAGGIFAALGFSLMPRVFYHSHLACFDVAISAMWLLVSYLYWRSLSSWRFGVAAGLAFGIALCVKLNAFFMPFLVGFHYLLILGHWYVQKRSLAKSSPSSEPLRSPKPWAFIFGLVLAPPIFFGHWPWLWYDTWSRLMKYVGFHSSHAHYNTAWFGENIVAEPTPLLLPFGMTLFTIPTLLLLLGAAGALLRTRHHFPNWLDRRVRSFWRSVGPESALGLDLLLLLSVAFPIVLISMPTVPVFGGTKHWMPAFPFICLLGAAAASRLVQIAVDVFHRVPAFMVTALTIAVLLVPPLHQTVTSHPLGLTSYVPFIGGAPGAATLGMTRQFWGYTTAGVLPWINEHVPERGGVFFHDTAAPSVRMFREDGLLRADIRSVHFRNSNAALVHHELHMINVEAMIWNRYRTFVPSYVLTHQGVPIVSVYSRSSK